MARKKTILKEHILETAYLVLRAEGFKGFTARNIAKQMDCSTQPIYLEFKNMDELKNELMAKVYTYLTEEVYNCPRIGNRMVDFCLNYIDFARREATFFSSLFLEKQIDACVLHEFSFQTLVDAMNKDGKAGKLDNEEKKQVFERIWPTIHGTATMVAQGSVSFDEDEVIDILKCLLPETDFIGTEELAYSGN